MTISTPVLMLLIVALAVKMKGAQLPHVVLGMLFATSVTPGGFINSLCLQLIAAINEFLTSLATAADGFV